MGFLRRLFGGSRNPAPPAEAPTAMESGGERRDLRAETLSVGQQRLIQGPPLPVMGESQYRDAFERVLGRVAEGHHDVVDAALVAEPENPHDPAAVAVYIGGAKCGYLRRSDARLYGPVMEWCRMQGFAPVVRGDVRGGWRQDDGTWADFGMTLYVASPNKLLGRAMPEPAQDHPWVGRTVVFTGDSRCAVNGDRLDRATCEAIARRAGRLTHPRITKAVTLLVDCDPDTTSGKERKALAYGIPVVAEPEFWAALGYEALVLDG